MRSFASSSGATKSSQVGFALSDAAVAARAIGEQLLDRGRDVLGLDPLELRQAGKIKQRVTHCGSIAAQFSREHRDGHRADPAGHRA